MITLSIFASKARKVLASRSWVSGRSFLRALHEHRDALLNANHQNLLFVAKKSRVATAREKTLGSARPKSAPVEVECFPTDPGFRVPGRNVPTDLRKTGRAGGLRPGDTANACRPRAIARDVAG
jgi:hypothetical protein